ncbi:hepatic lectin-like [Acipenser ruthenus]|uniref:hepatic lectin-like n=1 Tax=Acipenser ruthenus TaxID=7906 RepID=UPI0027405FAF|nr:hepatic lectin-like [Acipenser ruthenus]
MSTCTFLLRILPLGREDDVTYATVKFAEAPSSQQQTDPSRTADPTPPVSAAGKASSYRQPALVFLILCCLLLAAIISLAVYLFRAKDTEKYTSPSTNDSSLLNQLQHNNRLSETHSELQKRGCSSEKWMQFNGKCYYFSTDTMNWHSSRASCVSMGADLVIIESEAEQRFLLNAAKAQTAGNRYWIGLTDAVTEGAWLWVDGTPLNDKAKYWYRNEPDDWKGDEDSSGQDCAELMSMSDTLKAWSDQSCTQQPNRWICETMAVIINI